MIRFEKNGPTSIDSANKKKEMRRPLCELLRRLSPQQRKEKSTRACHNLMATEVFEAASTVMMYLSLDYEVDTTEAIRVAWHLGKTVVVPKVYWDERRMAAIRIDSLEAPFSTEVLGLRNPVSEEQVSLAAIDLVVVPAFGYDMDGNRLGHGGGYYDRFFLDSDLRAVRCGFAFGEQVVDRIPTYETDQSVELLVTDKQTVHCRH